MNIAVSSSASAPLQRCERILALGEEYLGDRELVAFEMGEVADKDLHLVVLGAVFNWTIGYMSSFGGTLSDSRQMFDTSPRDGAPMGRQMSTNSHSSPTGTETARSGGPAAQISVECHRVREA